MTEKSFCIITTTINTPHLLRQYVLDSAQFGRRLEQLIVIGDLKTPTEAKEYCDALSREFHLPIRFVSADNQKDLLKQWPVFAEFLPWNCIQRRNIGLLLAYQGTADIVVTIDDDNFLSQADYLGFHAHLGETLALESVNNQAGWWNVCDMLECAQGIRFYHRGHPLSKRWSTDEDYETITKVRGRAVVNAGLWLDDPDVDALTRLYFPIRVTKPSKSYRERIACGIGTWAPFNSQNTALLRELIPAYFLFPHIGRYDDIWASYVIRHISDSLGDYVTYGAPLVRQKRNPHNYFKDFDAERFGMECNDVFLQALKSCRVTARDYKGAFVDISRQFSAEITRACEAVGKDVELFENVIKGFKVWSDLFADSTTTKGDGYGEKAALRMR
jgi:hypothetical protein